MNKQMNNSKFAQGFAMTTANVEGFILDIDCGVLLPCLHSGTK